MCYLPAVVRCSSFSYCSIRIQRIYDFRACWILSGFHFRVVCLELGYCSIKHLNEEGRLHVGEEEMPDVEIDIDDLLDANSEEERASKLQEALVDCYKPTEEFIRELLSRIRGMRKLSPPQKKSV
ncbi:protein phosphatase 1 regulatory subunit 14C isoform X5 [Mus musculus]|uniref:protein phosphatase 1 regulatory subunit 14C isoform X5 n=1 Tax=Mus musculus TaxID=10090 RepID=UPI00167BFC1C|nr:protein phosphatase 1 regulatory subunit 14C isoform X5 [Mus musculus]